jgi:hypothetical protein
MKKDIRSPRSSVHGQDRQLGERRGAEAKSCGGWGATAVGDPGVGYFNYLQGDLGRVSCG